MQEGMPLAVLQQTAEHEHDVTHYTTYSTGSSEDATNNALQLCSVLRCILATVLQAQQTSDNSRHNITTTAAATPHLQNQQVRLNL
jgi:hypothetical protein